MIGSVWGYIGVILGLYIRVISGLYKGYVRAILGLYRGCKGAMEKIMKTTLDLIV